MADVFLSYSSDDRERIRPIARALEKNGLTVWWDRDIQAGTAYDREIESAIAAAKCVVVIWSRHSIESEYVRSEVDDAANRNILVPVLIEDVQPPLAHRRRQAAILKDWSGETEGEFEKLIQGIRATIGSSEDSARQESAPPARGRRRYAIGAILTIAVLASLYAYRESLILVLLLNAPALFFGEPIEQELGFATASDGTRIAYATSGAGPVILQVMSVNTHLQSGQSSPIYDNDGLLALSSRNNLFVRYDGRGTGLSDRAVTDFSLSARLSDIEAVVDALGLEHFGILAVSAGGQAAIAYTAEHPERVTHLVLAGAIASYNFGEEPVFSKEMLDLIETSWQRPMIANMFADVLLTPGGSALDRSFVSEMLRRANDGPTLAAFYRTSGEIDVTEAAKRIQIPTLVIQARDDAIVPLEIGRAQASLIPGAKLEIVEGGHMASSASTAETRRRALEFLAEGK